MAAKTNLEQFKLLSEKKDKIENEITELSNVLQTQGVGIDGSLVDGEDYPRADIDIYTVRHARHRIKVLGTDHKAIMRQIEDTLYAIHAEARAHKLSDGVEQMEVVTSYPSAVQAMPFATVDRVDAGSPAEQAGVMVGDQIIQFGSITKTNFENLKMIGALVQSSKGISISVRVLRNSADVGLSLVPQTWSGRGMLGCNIVPYTRR